MSGRQSHGITAKGSFIGRDVIASEKLHNRKPFCRPLKRACNLWDLQNPLLKAGGYGSQGALAGHLRTQMIRAGESRRKDRCPRLQAGDWKAFGCHRATPQRQAKILGNTGYGSQANFAGTANSRCTPTIYYP